MDKENEPEPQYYERSTVVETEFGFVKVEQLDWAHNHGKYLFTVFSIVINGYKHSAFIDQARLSDSELKNYATHFSKIVHNAYT